MTKTDDLHLWRLFCEVVRSGGVNAACEKLQCEPSTVSRAVKALETELGLPLFEREGRTLKLTELGSRAHQQAEALLARHDEMIARALCGSPRTRGSAPWKSRRHWSNS